MNPLRSLHHRLVVNRRVGRLADLLMPLIPAGARVLDLGAGDGAIARAIRVRRPDIAVTALEVKAREETAIPELLYDGHTVPFRDGAFDCVLLIDVVHHAWNPPRLLSEARRVASQRVILKDHLARSAAARITLSFMDWISNAKYGIAMPYTYWNRAEWDALFDASGLEVETWSGRLQLYPRPASYVFDASLQFIASLSVNGRPFR
jgi:SAM-dependent methyltransferase